MIVHFIVAKRKVELEEVSTSEVKTSAKSPVKKEESSRKVAPII